MQPIVAIAFLSTYCVMLLLWARELRDKLGLRLESFLAKWQSGRSSAPAAQVVALLVATFLPIAGLFAAARWHAITWQRANSMLVFTLLLPALTFATGDRSKRERS